MASSNKEMKSTQTELSKTGQKLLALLVSEINKGRFNINAPEEFLGYGEALDLLNLPPDAPRGETDGQTLQLNGLNNLARWIRTRGKVPKITGLIVWKQGPEKGTPGGGYFKEYNIQRNGKEYAWWLDECRKALVFDWSPFLPIEEKFDICKMNPLERSLIERAGYSNGWENVRISTPEHVIMFSARHKAEAHVLPSLKPGGAWRVIFPHGPQATELVRSLPEMQDSASGFHAQGEVALGKLLRRAAELAMSLPNHAAELYAEEVGKIEAQVLGDTEALRMVKQRVGQDIFRTALMKYWGGACAVTGLAIPELLRASHAKPWAICATDAERLDVFNGFLLAAHFDALFDGGLLSFDDRGCGLFSSRLTADQVLLLGIAFDPPVKLRWISPEHLAFLDWHRKHIFQP